MLFGKKVRSLEDAEKLVVKHLRQQGVKEEEIELTGARGRYRGSTLWVRGKFRDGWYYRVTLNYLPKSGYTGDFAIYENGQVDGRIWSPEGRIYDPVRGIFPTD